jgi:hypothetical protein
MMKRNGLGRATIVAASLAALAACGDSTPPPAVERAQVTSGEWTPLFNGKNLDGWRSYAAGGALNPHWIVEDGAIVLDVAQDTDETTGGDLITVDQYENFELELEWKISEGGNSGIFFGVREIPGHEVAYESGIEMQVLDDDRHVDGRVPETSAGACYGMYAPEGKVLRPVGEYNKVRLLVNDGHVEHWLNGKKIVDYVIGSDDWNKRIETSKFSDWEHFAQYREGHIGLQDHSDRVWFRNIRIRIL